MTPSLETAYPEALESPGLALWRVTNAWQRHIRAVLAPHDLTHVQFVLLASLTWMDRSEAVTQRDLAAHASTDVMMTSQVIRTLEAKGYIRRAPHPTDGRAVTLTPTPEGIALANRANTDVEAADRTYFEALDPVARQSFIRHLRTLDQRPIRDNQH
ncbi:MarR family transcriptional regulator [Cryobacterium algoritolerans]|uniref:MarR family transcriptional regulator n=1 Tax=Cryobacterium algoritolerans TaxID=1259184 RepID=A0A4R8WV18_9MICO|nr:MarR family transcriptional regulator [Cryobacterium algoritolerans]TFC16262.1 MarR family transcriptional regulator [Cryobacterium algoritolerans]